MTNQSPPLSSAVMDRVRQSFIRQGLMSHLGAELVDVQAGRVTIRLSHRPEVSQQHGYIYAGATATIADSAGGYAALTLMDDNSEVLTVEYKLNLLAPATGQYLEAVGEVLRPGRTLTVCRLDVWAVDGDDRSLIATGQQTVIRVSNQDAPQPAI